MLSVANNLQFIKAQIPSEVRLVAVSKFHAVEMIAEAYAQGQRVFGESREQELSKKAKLLPNDIEWHFIGHLQTNKVKNIVPYIKMIETVDSAKILCEINRQAAKINRVIDVLLELHIAEEATKFGFSLPECTAFLEEGVWKQLSYIRIVGLMMMASNVEDEAQIKAEMTKASNYFDELKDKYFSNNSSFCVKSWGMSSDYAIAIQCHSTQIRVGSAIFGNRNY